MRILVVEDDPSIAEFVAAGLRQEGFAVDVASNGVDGLDRASTHPYDAPAVVRAGWMVIENPPGGSVLEVGSARLADGVIVQVGRSSHVRDELLGHFRERGL